MNAAQKIPKFGCVFALLLFSLSYSADKKTVVFMGDSITEGWEIHDPSYFAGKPYLNRGISGQTTEEMVERFQQDVINARPAAVVILAGTNDIAENAGPITLEEITKNIVRMAELARTNKIDVVLCSVLPAYDYPWRPGLKPTEKIAKLNAMIKNYAMKNNLAYVDYYSAMVDGQKGLKSSYSEDGVHPNLAGYKVMEPLVEKAIAEVIKAE